MKYGISRKETSAMRREIKSTASTEKNDAGRIENL